MGTVSRLIDMSGRVVIVTGGAGYIGRAIGDAFMELGAIVIATDISQAGLDAYAKTTAAGNLDGTLETAVLDLEDEAAIRQFCSDVEERHGIVSSIIHNAGFVGTAASDGWATPFDTQSSELWRRAIEVNLTAPFVMTQALTPALKKSGHGSVVMVGSIYGLVGPDWRMYAGTSLGNPAAYAASKGGLMQFTRWLSTTLAPDIRVNAFCPGGLERGQDEKFLEKYNARTPMGRMATPEDMVGAAVFLACDLSAYVTGQVIAVDGGWTAW